MYIILVYALFRPHFSSNHQYLIGSHIFSANTNYEWIILHIEVDGNRSTQHDIRFHEFEDKSDTTNMASLPLLIRMLKD